MKEVNRVIWIDPNCEMPKVDLNGLSNTVIAIIDNGISDAMVQAVYMFKGEWYNHFLAGSLYSNGYKVVLWTHEPYFPDAIRYHKNRE
jgi:hypothetical protein